MPEGNALEGPKGTAGSQRLPGGRTPVKLPMAPFHQTHHAVSREVVLHVFLFCNLLQKFHSLIVSNTRLLSWLLYPYLPDISKEFLGMEVHTCLYKIQLSSF